MTTRPPTKTTPDEQLKLLCDGLTLLGLGEMRRALDETLAEPAKDVSRLDWRGK